MYVHGSQGVQAPGVGRRQTWLLFVIILFLGSSTVRGQSWAQAAAEKKESTLDLRGTEPPILTIGRLHFPRTVILATPALQPHGRGRQSITIAHLHFVDSIGAPIVTHVIRAVSTPGHPRIAPPVTWTTTIERTTPIINKRASRETVNHATGAPPTVGKALISITIASSDCRELTGVWIARNVTGRATTYLKIVLDAMLRTTEAQAIPTTPLQGFLRIVSCAIRPTTRAGRKPISTTVSPSMDLTIGIATSVTRRVIFASFPVPFATRAGTQLKSTMTSRDMYTIAARVMPVTPTAASIELTGLVLENTYNPAPQNLQNRASLSWPSALQEGQACVVVSLYVVWTISAVTMPVGTAMMP